MMKALKQPAFTFVEMIVSITVFTLFIGMAISSYLYFHRVQKDIAAERGLLFEAQSVLDVLSLAITESRLDYAAYDSPSAALESSELFLLDAQGQHWKYVWNSGEKTFSLQGFDAAGEALPGFGEPQLLHSANVQMESVRFSIYPPVNPLSELATSVDEFQYQPHIQIDLVLAAPSQEQESLSIDLHSTLTFRTF